MIFQEYRCSKCGSIIPKEQVQHYGSQPVSMTKKLLFQIKRSVSGGEKEVQKWRSAIFCEKCTNLLELTYTDFIGDGNGR